jgi:hypothetical protein
VSVTDSQRRQLYADLERLVGRDSADVMMELLPPVGWSDVARQPLMDAQFVAVRGEMAELRAELRGEIGGIKGELAGLVRRLAAVNAVSVVAASMSTAGLVLAAAHFT